MTNIWVTILFLVSMIMPVAVPATASTTSYPVKIATAHSNAPSNPTMVHSNVPSQSLAQSTTQVTPVTSSVHYTSTPSTSDKKPVTPPSGVLPPCVSDPNANKDPCPPDPNRPQYDMWGNKFDAVGNLLWASCPNQPDPVTGKDNPYCVCPAPNNDGVYYVQGNDKNTNRVVCGFGYYHQCPYADAVSADDPLCYKLGAEQGK